MRALSFLLVILVILFLNFSHLTSAVVTSCIAGDYDLSKIPETSLLAKQFNTNGGSSEFEYTWDMLPCSSNTGYVKQSDGLTVYKTMNLNTINIISKGVEVEFSGDGATFSLELMCGNSQTLTWPSADYRVTSNKIIGAPEAYTATALTSVLCSVTPPSHNSNGGCGGGCAFVIIFFVGLALYIIITIAWYYFQCGKRGRELLPHPEFWSDVPFLLKDGVVYVYNKIAGCFGGGNRTETYEQVY